MDTPSPSLAAEVNALKQAYDALNRNDIPAFVQMFDAEVERIEHFPAGGAYHGLEALKAHALLQRGKWAEGSCEPERFVVAGNRIVVFVHVRVRLKDESEWREGHIADGFSFRGGKAYEFHSFIDSQQALEWAGAKASDAN